MNLTEQEIKKIVAATVVAMGKGGAAGGDLPISNQQQSRALTIPAHSQRHAPFRGSYVAIYSNTSTNAVLVSMDNGLTNFIKAGTGYPCVRLSRDKTTYEPAVFTRVTFENTTDEDMTIEYVLSLGPVTDTRAVIEGAVSIDPGGEAFDVAVYDLDHENTTIIPSNALIKERVIQNNSYVNVWVGKGIVTAENGAGILVENGGGIVVLPIRSALYAIAAADPGPEGCRLSVLNTLKG